ncbi:hypothetical protein OHA98_20690 [Streptomyces sp. NBC_00654]|nr:hypothetical protein [Streptomyces sp. NBC_00654]MCX4967160.1 hypothetical protein [Streptomyces sp. NBC_00654]
MASISKATAIPGPTPAPTHHPEQLGLGLGVGAYERAVGQDDLDSADVVDGEPVLPYQPANAASGGDDAADADVPVVSRADDETVRGERLGDLGPAGTRLDTDQAGVAVDDLAPGQRAQVERSNPPLVPLPDRPCPPLRTATWSPGLPRGTRRCGNFARGLRPDDGGRAATVVYVDRSVR